MSVLPKKKDNAIQCKNCETEFSGNFCPECGQSKTDYDKPLRFLFYDFAGNVFAFDSRLWKTFITLITHPGQTSLDFIHGKRMRYMPPFRMYVFISFVFFLLLNLNTFRNEKSEKMEHTAVIDSLKNEQVYAGVYYKTEVENKENVNKSTKNGTLKIGNKEIDLKEVATHQRFYITKFLKGLSFSLFLLMPFYGFMLWLFFRKTYRYYMGHLVLAINQQAFTFIILIIVLIIKLVFPHWQNSPESYLLLFLPVYFVVGARKMYANKWITTIWKLTVIWFFYLLISIANLAVIFYYTFFITN